MSMPDRIFARDAIRFFVLVIIASLFTACANSPLSIAETPAQKYDAVRLTYDALLTPAVAIVEDEDLPLNVRQSMQRLIATSGEIYAGGTQVYIEYRAARAAVAAGTSPESRLAIATENLDQWVASLERLLDEIVLLL